MNISGPFIRRSVMTTLIMMGILLFGIMGYRLLPVSDLPNVDFPTIVVTASLPGANPDTMASAVATPLERQFSTISGLDNMSSVNSLGFSQITLQFNLKRNIDEVAPDIDAAIAQATPFLPPDLPSPPTYRKVNPADQPILYIALTSPTLPLWQVDDYGETLMAQRISMVNGVAQVTVFGSQKYAVRAQVNPDALASRRIDIDEVRQAIAAANVNLPVGTLWGSQRAFTIKASGQLLRADAYNSIIIAYRNGSPVYLRDIGRAIDSVEDDKTAAWYLDKNSSQRSLVLAIQRQPGANTVAVSDAIKNVLPSLEAYLPPSVVLHILYDRSETIRASIRDVKVTMVVTLCLVVLVIFLFLRTLPATVIASTALPLSIIGTFAAMYFLKFNLDNLSLMALILAIGFVVDDAIVMLENIVRHLEMGEPPFQAAVNASQEIGFTILSMTISLAAVFIPVLFMGGILGRLFREFSVTICVAVLISGFISLSLTPMLCSRFLRSSKERKHGRVYNAFERAFQWMLLHYERSLQWVLHHRRLTMILSLIILVLTGFLFVKVPKGFLPSGDNSQVFIVTEGPQGISFDSMSSNQQVIAQIIQRDPNVENFFSGVGGAGASSLGGPNFGRLFLHLKSPSERKLDADEVIAELRPKVATASELNVFMQNPPTIRVGGQLTKGLYQFSLQSPDLEELYRAAPRLLDKLRQLPELQDVTSDLQIRNPQVNILIDRDRAATLGITAQQLESVLFSAYGDRWISTIFAPNNQYKVLLELEPQYQTDPTLLSRLYLRAGSAPGAITAATNVINTNFVPLDTIANRSQDVGPQTINHIGQLPSVTISFNLKPGVSLGDVVAKVQAAARQTLPANITTSFQGTAQAFQSSLRGMGLLLLVAIVFIYIILGILYESFVHPLTILSGLPSAGFGALLALLIFRAELNLYSFVGLIMLIGIVKKNAIMQIDFALAAERKEGKAPLDAIYEGCVLRFRPIMMTTMAALLGTLPIAIGFGAGAEERRSLGIAVVGGLLFSQLITLYLTPVVYFYMDIFQAKFGQQITGLRNSLKLKKRKPAPA